MSPGLCPGSLGGLALPPQADGHACGSHSPPTGGPPSTRVPVFSLAVVLLRYPGGAGTEGAAARDRSVRWLSCPGFADGGSFCDRRPHGHPPSPGAGPGFLWASWCGELRFGAAKGWGGGTVYLCVCLLPRALLSVLILHAAPGACPLLLSPLRQWTAAHSSSGKRFLGTQPHKFVGLGHLRLLPGPPAVTQGGGSTACVVHRDPPCLGDQVPRERRDSRTGQGRLL